MKREKNILFILTILLLLACTACDRSARHVTEHLSQAEELIWTAPDSALHLLESISASRHLTGKEQADYALLLSLAQYRCYIPVSSDSLINLAIEYYKDKNDADKKGAAFYVKGCILEEYTKDIPNALLAYKEAEMCIPDMNEKRYVARIYSSLGYINKKSFHFDPAKEYYQKAVQANIDGKDTVAYASNLLNLSTLYYTLHQADSANRCINTLIDIADSLNDLDLQVKIYNNIANRKIFEKNYAEAEKYLIHAIRLSSPHFPDKLSLGLANLYAYTGQKEKADSLFTHLLSCPDLLVRSNSYLDLLNYFLASHPQEHSYLNHYIALTDSIYKENRAEEVGKIQQKYDNEVLARTNDQLYFKWILTSVVGSLICIIAVTFLQKKWRKANALQKQIEELEEKKKVLTSSSQENERYVIQISELESQINDLKNEKRRLKYFINKTKESKKDKEDDYSSIFKTYLSITKDKTYDKERERDNLRQWLNLTNQNFTDKLIKHYPVLSKSNQLMDVCCLTALNLSIEDIATLLGIGERTVERYTSDICKKVGLPKGGKHIFVEFINSIKELEA
ncbi:tetratricopeptide repeat protein [Phocaeicola massiliensis]|uniref:tetratricopeptide repeat protein n=1 Tax=Phocaeicola massiliensis TaxID=204516 RepID=UPI0035618FD2